MRPDLPVHLRIIHERVIEALERLSPMFVPGMELTFIARHPTNPHACTLVSQSAFDDLHEVLRVIEADQALAAGPTTTDRRTP